jgi:hypothetical protein
MPLIEIDSISQIPILPLLQERGYMFFGVLEVDRVV